MNIAQVIIISIDKYSDSSSKYYGRLVKCNYTSLENKWYYGIGLSDEKIFIFDIDQNSMIVEANFPIFTVDFYTQKFSQDQIIERLKYTVIYINKNKLEFDNERWNDEHFARFIVTNNAVSYRVSNKKFKNNNILKKEINKYIKQSNPDLYIKTNINAHEFFIPKIWHRGRFWVFIFLTIFSIILYAVLASISFPQKLIFFILAIILMIILIIINRLSQYKWSGFQNKQLWNWLELLIIPILLVIGGFILENNAEQRIKDSSIEKEKQESLKEYFKSVQMIVASSSKRNSSKTKPSKLVDNLTYIDKELIESFTQLVLSEINGDQKRQVVKFLYELELIKCNQQKNCPNVINLDPFDLTEAKLENLDLKKIFLHGANLTSAKLNGTNLEFADLQNTILEKTEFNLARLKNVNMGQTSFGKDVKNIEIGKKWKKINEITSFNCLPEKKTESQDTQESCSPQNTSNTNELDFTDQDFSKANLEKLDLRKAYLWSADLSGATITGSAKKNTNLNQADFNSANLSEATLSNVDLTEVSLRAADLSKAILKNTNFDKANLKNADLSGADLSNAQNLDKAILKGATYDNDTKFPDYLDLKTAGVLFENIDIALRAKVRTNKSCESK